MALRSPSRSSFRTLSLTFIALSSLLASPLASAATSYEEPEAQAEQSLVWCTERHVVLADSHASLFESVTCLSDAEIGAWMAATNGGGDSAEASDACGLLLQFTDSVTSWVAPCRSEGSAQHPACSLTNLSPQGRMLFCAELMAANATVSRVAGPDLVPVVRGILDAAAFLGFLQSPPSQSSSAAPDATSLLETIQQIVGGELPGDPRMIQKLISDVNALLEEWIDGNEIDPNALIGEANQALQEALDKLRDANPCGDVSASASREVCGIALPDPDAVIIIVLALAAQIQAIIEENDPSEKVLDTAIGVANQVMDIVESVDPQAIQDQVMAAVNAVVADIQDANPCGDVTERESTTVCGVELPDADATIDDALRQVDAAVRFIEENDPSPEIQKLIDEINVILDAVIQLIQDTEPPNAQDYIDAAEQALQKALDDIAEANPCGDVAQQGTGTTICGQEIPDPQPLIDTALATVQAILDSVPTVDPNDVIDDVNDLIDSVDPEPAVNQVNEIVADLMEMNPCDDVQTSSTTVCGVAIPDPEQDILPTIQAVLDIILSLLPDPQDAISDIEALADAVLATVAAIVDGLPTADEVIGLVDAQIAQLIRDVEDANPCDTENDGETEVCGQDVPDADQVIQDLRDAISGAAPCDVDDTGRDEETRVCGILVPDLAEAVAQAIAFLDETNPCGDVTADAGQSVCGVPTPEDPVGTMMAIIEDNNPCGDVTASEEANTICGVDVDGLIEAVEGLIDLVPTSCEEAVGLVNAPRTPCNTEPLLDCLTSGQECGVGDACQELQMPGIEVCQDLCDAVEAEGSDCMPVDAAELIAFATETAALIIDLVVACAPADVGASSVSQADTECPAGLPPEVVCAANAVGADMLFGGSEESSGDASTMEAAMALLLSRNADAHGDENCEEPPCEGDCGEEPDPCSGGGLEEWLRREPGSIPSIDEVVAWFQDYDPEVPSQEDLMAFISGEGPAPISLPSGQSQAMATEGDCGEEPDPCQEGGLPQFLDREPGDVPTVDEVVAFIGEFEPGDVPTPDELIAFIDGYDPSLPGNEGQQQMATSTEECGEEPGPCDNGSGVSSLPGGDGASASSTEDCPQPDPCAAPSPEELIGYHPGDPLDVQALLAQVVQKLPSDEVLRLIYGDDSPPVLAPSSNQAQSASQRSSVDCPPCPVVESVAPEAAQVCGDLPDVCDMLTQVDAGACTLPPCASSVFDYLTASGSYADLQACLPDCHEVVPPGIAADLACHSKGLCDVIEDVDGVTDPCTMFDPCDPASQGPAYYNGDLDLGYTTHGVDCQQPPPPVLPDPCPDLAAVVGSDFAPVMDVLCGKASQLLSCDNIDGLVDFVDDIPPMADPIDTGVLPCVTISVNGHSARVPINVPVVFVQNEQEVRAYTASTTSEANCIIAAVWYIGSPIGCTKLLLNPGEVVGAGWFAGTPILGASIGDDCPVDDPCVIVTGFAGSFVAVGQPGGLGTLDASVGILGTQMGFTVPLESVPAAIEGIFDGFDQPLLDESTTRSAIGLVADDPPSHVTASVNFIAPRTMAGSTLYLDAGPVQAGFFVLPTVNNLGMDITHGYAVDLVYDEQRGLMNIPGSQGPVDRKHVTMNWETDGARTSGLFVQTDPSKPPLTFTIQKMPESIEGIQATFADDGQDYLEVNAIWPGTRPIDRLDLDDGEGLAVALKRVPATFEAHVLKSVQEDANELVWDLIDVSYKGTRNIDDASLLGVVAAPGSAQGTVARGTDVEFTFDGLTGDLRNVADHLSVHLETEHEAVDTEDLAALANSLALGVAATPEADDSIEIPNFVASIENPSEPSGLGPVVGYVSVQEAGKFDITATGIGNTHVRSFLDGDQRKSLTFDLGLNSYASLLVDMTMAKKPFWASATASCAALSGFFTLQKAQETYADDNEKGKKKDLDVEFGFSGAPVPCSSSYDPLRLEVQVADDAANLYTLAYLRNIAKASGHVDITSHRNKHDNSPVASYGMEIDIAAELQFGDGGGDFFTDATQLLQDAVNDISADVSQAVLVVQRGETATLAFTGGGGRDYKGDLIPQEGATYKTFGWNLRPDVEAKYQLRIDMDLGINHLIDFKANPFQLPPLLMDGTNLITKGLGSVIACGELFGQHYQNPYERVAQIDDDICGDGNHRVTYELLYDDDPAGAVGAAVELVAAKI